jgi:peptidyl-prolyl cis-trans isomerase C
VDSKTKRNVIFLVSKQAAEKMKIDLYFLLLALIDQLVFRQPSLVKAFQMSYTRQHWHTQQHDPKQSHVIATLNYENYSHDPFRRNRVEMKMIYFAGIFDGMQDFLKRFTTRASASHILIKGGSEAEHKLEDLKAEIGNSPVKFAEYASRYSECPSASSGGDLGEFGPGTMVKEFDEVVFNESVGEVHGPIKTQFGCHLIYIRERTD